MKMKLLTTAIAIAFASTGAFAHHPAADIVPPEIYEMIDENVSDTPHADMVFDDMGRDADDVGTARENRGEMGSDNTSSPDDEEVSADERGQFEQARNEDGPDDIDTEVTIDLLENLAN